MLVLILRMRVCVPWLTVYNAPPCQSCIRALESPCWGDSIFSIYKGQPGDLRKVSWPQNQPAWLPAAALLRPSTCPSSLVGLWVIAVASTVRQGGQPLRSGLRRVPSSMAVRASGQHAQAAFSLSRGGSRGWLLLDCGPSSLMPASMWTWEEPSWAEAQLCDLSDCLDGRPQRWL